MHYEADFANIIHFTTGGNEWKLGYRNPAIWFRPLSLTLSFRSTINGAWNYGFTPCEIKIPMHAFTEIRIEQLYVYAGNYLTTVRINGTTCERVFNIDAMHFENVTVYAADPWYQPANAIMKDYEFKNL